MRGRVGRTATRTGAALALLLAACAGGCSKSERPGGGDAAAPVPKEGEDTLARIKREGVLKWGADPSGGGPHVYLDEKDPTKIVGFEVDIMDKFAAHLGVKHRIARNDWDVLIPDLQRGGSSDLVMNGVEINADREKEVGFSKPYFIYEQQLTVRAGDKDKYKSLEDLKGHKIATLKAAQANNVLGEAGWTKDLIQQMPDSVTPYDELENKRVDAVLQENIIAEFYANPKRRPDLHNIPTTFSPGKYAVAVRKEDAALLKEVDRILDLMKENGELAGIYKRWNMWSAKQAEIGIKEKPAP
jgi:polar amino acid transport system substrate-binding protein